MKKETNVVRTNLTAENVETLNTILQAVVKGNTSSSELRSVALLLRVASDMASLASDLHESEIQVPWNSVCWAAHLSQNMVDMEETAKALTRILEPLRVRLTEPPKGGMWRCKFPMLKAYEPEDVFVG